MASMSAGALKALFSLLGLFSLGCVIFSIYKDGLPFRKELVTPWMAATLVDFYICIFTIMVWVVYKETNWIDILIWVDLLICLGSIATCTYIVIQLIKFSSQDHVWDPMYFILVRDNHMESERTNTFPYIVAVQFLFGALACSMLATLIYTIATDGSPFRRELFTTWMKETLIDFYINIAAFSVWVAYKESSWISALVWIILLICTGSIAICTYIVVQLFQLSAEDPLYLVLLKNCGRNNFKMPMSSTTRS